MKSKKIRTEEALASKLVFGKHKVSVMEYTVMLASKLQCAAPKHLCADKVSKRLKLVRNKLHAHFKVALDIPEKEVEPVADSRAKPPLAPSPSAEEALVVDFWEIARENVVRWSTRNRKHTGSVHKTIAEGVYRNKRTTKRRPLLWLWRKERL